MSNPIETTSTTTAPDLRAVAFDLALQGFKVFPLQPKSKFPIPGISWKGLVCANEVDAWAKWSLPEFQASNIGIHCEGLIVVDLDLYKDTASDAEAWLAELDLPQTFTVQTARGGRHLYFKGPDVANSASKLAPGIDVRGVNGYVVAPGSVTPDGAYTVFEDLPLAVAPQALIDKCKAAKESQRRDEVDWGAPTSEARLLDGRAYLATAPVSIQGVGGDHTAFRVISELWDRGVSASGALDLLLEDWNQRCLPAWSDDELRGLIHHVHTYAQNNFAARASDQVFGEVVLVEDPEAVTKARSLEDPVDLWGIFPAPDLPLGALPRVLEEFALVQGEMMGADPAGLAVAALVTCAAAIDDRIQVQVKRHDPHWCESARIWAALVGSPSTKKSPILSAATAPLCRLDGQMFREWQAEVSAFLETPKDERKGRTSPAQRRLRIEDATVEAAQVVLEGSPWGILLLQDELSGFFGAMDKYSGGKGAAADRAFWLRSFNGGEYALNRVGRGTALLPNLSVCLLGGIQPEPIRKVAADAHDDGLLQRLFPIVLKPATIGRDAPSPDAVGRYSATVQRLRQMRAPLAPLPIQFDDDAQLIRRGLEEKHLHLQASEAVSRKLASHIGKYDGLFARLCLLWHCIESADPHPPRQISAATAARVAGFLHGFLLRHAAAFYGGVLGLSDDHDRLQAIAGYILARKLDRLTNRDVQRGDGTMRSIREADIRPLLEQLAALGWLERVDGARPTSQPHWLVNPAVHQKFEERARAEEARRADARAAIAEVTTGQGK